MATLGQCLSQVAFPHSWEHPSVVLHIQCCPCCSFLITFFLLSVIVFPFFTHLPAFLPLSCAASIIFPLPPFSLTFPLLLLSPCCLLYNFVFSEVSVSHLFHSLPLPCLHGSPSCLYPHSVALVSLNSIPPSLWFLFHPCFVLVSSLFRHCLSLSASFVNLIQSSFHSSFTPLCFLFVCWPSWCFSSTFPSILFVLLLVLPVFSLLFCCFWRTFSVLFPSLRPSILPRPASALLASFGPGFIEEIVPDTACRYNSSPSHCFSMFGIIH